LIRRIYEEPSVDGFAFSYVGWSPDSKLLTYIRSGDGNYRLCSWNAADGTSSVLFDYAALKPPTEKTGGKKPKMAQVVPPWRTRLIKNKPEQSYTWTPNGKWIILGPPCGPLYRLDPATGKTARISNAPPDWITDFKLSPDSRWLSYVCAFNIYLVDLETLETIPFTADGTETARNATPDATNEMLDSGHWWSPDSTKIACLVTYTGYAFQYPLQNLLSRLAPIQYMRFVMPGQPGCISAIRVLSPQGAVWIDLSPWLGWYLATVDWLPDSRTLAIQMLNRQQNQLVLVFADSVTGQVFSVLSESDPAWINPCGDLRFFKDGKRFLWSSEKESYRQLYLYAEGRKPVQLTRGNEAVLSTAGVDEASGTIYYLTSPEPHTDLQLKYVRFHDDGQRVVVEPAVSVTTTPGTHLVSISPDFRYFADEFSTVNQPPSLLVQPFDGKAEAVEDNHDAMTTTAKLPQCQFLTLQAAQVGNPSDSMLLLGRLIPPDNLQPGQRYPVVVYVYGGPIQGQDGLDRVVVNYWQHTPDLWLRLLAQHGVGVFSVDNRGSNAAPRGHNFETPIYGRLGQIERQDQLAGIQYLKKKVAWVDPERLAIVGGSFGGFMALNLLLNAPGVFSCGAVFAPVTNWLAYNALYTERYMGLPSVNPDGYRTSSVLHQAAGMPEARELLLLHGTADPDVHFSHSLQMLNEFQKVNKQCQLMAYPGADHLSFFVYGNRPLELFVWMTQFLVTHLHLPKNQQAGA
jgi:dipeptidyl-peptidase-4